MNILHVNVRLSQGGAGRVAWDLHRRLNASGVVSRFAYGYASGIVDDPAARGDPSVTRLSHRPTVLANYAVHRVIGRDWLTENKPRVLQLLTDADVVHLHAVHHYFLDGNWLLKTLVKLRKPTVITAHDWWYVSGRCGFPGSCTAWAAACGRCGAQGDADHLPALFDFSQTWRRARRNVLAELAPRLEIAAPSRHIMSDYQSTLPGTSIHYVPNTYDGEFEEILKTAHKDSAEHAALCRPVVAIVAADLSYQPKTDASFVRSVVKSTGAKLVTVGKNSPFSGDGIVNHGYVSDRGKLAAIIRGAHYLLYSSVVDNAPLTIIESLALGTPVIGRSAAATSELLSLVGAFAATDAKKASAVMNGGWPIRFYPAVSCRAELAKKAQEAFSPDVCVESYLQIYKDAITRSLRAARSLDFVEPTGRR